MDLEKERVQGYLDEIVERVSNNNVSNIPQVYIMSPLPYFCFKKMDGEKHKHISSRYAVSLTLSIISFHPFCEKVK